MMGNINFPSPGQGPTTMWAPIQPQNTSSQSTMIPASQSEPSWFSWSEVFGPELKKGTMNKGGSFLILRQSPKRETNTTLSIAMLCLHFVTVACCTLFERSLPFFFFIMMKEKKYDFSFVSIAISFIFFKKKSCRLRG
ncbi:hypothetical protein ACJX0J_038286 [Zea mays]